MMGTGRPGSSDADAPRVHADADMLFAGAGGMRAVCRAHDWAATPLGPVAEWPTSLRTAVGLVLAAPTAMIVLWGPRLVQVYNDAYRLLMGAKHPGGLGQPTRECWPEVWDFNAPLYDAVTRRGEAFTFTDRRLVVERHGEREEAFFTLTYSPIPADDGSVGGVLVTVFETTAQVRARTEREQERDAHLAESEAARARVTATLESIGDAFYAVDADFRFTYVNRRAEELWGRPRAELLGRHYWSEFPQAVGSEAYRHHLMVMGDRRPAHFEAVSPIVGRWVEVSIYPDDAGGGLACYFRDVSDRKQGEAERDQLLHDAQLAREAAEQAALAAARSEARYRMLFDSIDSGFCVIEMIFDARERPVDYRFVEANPAFGAQTGLVNVEGRTARELVPSLEEHWFETYGRVATTGEAIRFQNGSDPMGRWFDVYAFRVGRPEERRVALLFTDVSETHRAAVERERLLSESERARGEAEAANRAKADFLAVMSHELRTPLNAIGGYTELLQMGLHGPLTEAQAHALGRIQQSQRHLLGLINEVLNYARVETGTVRFDVEDVAVADAVASAEALITPQIDAKGLVYRFGGCVPSLAVRADAEKLRQILLNLLTNAVKFTDAGGEIGIACEVRDDVVAISVSDTGQGVAPEKLASIFEPFVQVDARLTRTQEGVGLGLAISRDLARGMGGELSVQSEPGVGSTFTLTLPAA